MSLFVEVHVLQSIPPSNMNRDDTGSPKSAVFGGVRRSRVSSQSWKKAMRDDFSTRFNEAELGLRSVRLVEELGTRIAERFPELADQANEIAAKTFTTAKLKVSKPRKSKDADAPDPVEVTGYLVFLSAQQLDALADVVGASVTKDGSFTLAAKDLLPLLKDKNSVDIALFGRMIADNTDLNVDAAAQVAHAIGVSKLANEFDYYTAVDDVKSRGENGEDAGAAMIGTVEFNSSTLYRYANVNATELSRNLGSTDAAVAALGKFIESFVFSMPAGKQNSFANRSLPDGVVVTIRNDQPISLANAFQLPVHATSERTIPEGAALALVRYAGELYEAYDNAPVKTFVNGVGNVRELLSPLGENLGLKELIERVQVAIAEGEK